MRKTFFVFLISLTMFQVLGQGNYYIYIQSADHKPFYVRSGSRVFYSSGNGYLVIDDLSSNTYDLIVGFPEGATAEWHFNCTLNDEDKAFILKNNSGKKVELSSLKNDEKQSGRKVEIKAEKIIPPVVKQATGIVSDDPFSSMLAAVVDDPTIRQQPVIIPRPEDSLKMVKNKAADSAKLVTTAAAKPVEPVVGKAVKDSVALTKTTTPTPATPVIKDTKQPDSQKIVDSSIAMAKDADVKSKKQETESKSRIKKPKLATISLDITRTKNKHAIPKAESKLTETPRKAPEINLPVASNPIAASNSEKEVAAEKAKAPKGNTTVVADTKHEQKPITPDKTKASVGEPPASSALINAALEEAEKRKQVGIGSTKTAIVLGASTSIKKTLQRKSREGTELIYIDEMENGSKDTIRILIPAND